MSDTKQFTDQITNMDRMWCEMCCGRPVTDLEVIEFKRDYLDWVNTMEKAFE